MDFDGTEVVYEEDDLNELVLAYAMTVHQAQSSEYPVVIMPLRIHHYMLLQRNLLYTAVTRAKKLFILLGREGGSDGRQADEGDSEIHFISCEAETRQIVVLK